MRVEGPIEMQRLREILPAAGGLSPRDFISKTREYDSMFPVGILMEEKANELASQLHGLGLQTQIA